MKVTHMQRQGLIGFVLGVFSALSIALLVAAESPTKTTEASNKAAGAAAGQTGRYQVVHLNSYSNTDTCWVIDTASGHLWKHFSSDKSWDDQGTVPSDSK